MFRLRIILVLGLLASGSIIQAQTTQDGKRSRNDNVNQSTKGANDITLIKDLDTDAGDQSPAKSLERAYGIDGSEGANTPTKKVGDEQRLDMGKIRVIKQASYDQMTPEQQARVDADPYWVISDKTRRQVMADVFTGEIELDIPAAAPGAEPVPVKKENTESIDWPD